MKKPNNSKSQGKSPQYDPDKWLEIVERYSQPNDDDINESLVRALEDPDESVRKIVVEELIMLHDLYAASSIAGVLLFGSKHARLAAAEVLGKLQDPFGFFYLIKALADHDPEVRIAVIEAFEKLGKIGLILYTKIDERLTDPIEPLAWMLEDPDFEVRWAAGKALVSIGLIQPTWVLLGLLLYGSKNAKRAAFDVMGRLVDSKNLWGQVTLLLAGKKRQRIAAAELLGEVDDSIGFVSYLYDALCDDEVEVRIVAAKALAQKGRPECQNWIKGDKEDFVRMAKSGKQSVFIHIIRGLASEKKMIRSVAYDTLVEFGYPHAMEALIEVLRFHAWEIRIPLADILAEYGDAKAVEPLIEVFRGHRNNDVRVAVANALGKLGDQRAIEPLKKMLEKVDGDVRKAVVEALQNLTAEHAEDAEK